MTHCPDSRLCFCKAAYGFSSRRCRVCHKYFSQGMLSKTKHWKSSVPFSFFFFEQEKSVGADWELSLTLHVRREEQIKPRTNEGSERLCDLKLSELHSLFISALVKLCCCWTGSRSERFIGKPTFPQSALAALAMCTQPCLSMFNNYTKLEIFFFFFIMWREPLRAISINSKFNDISENLSDYFIPTSTFPLHIDCSVSAWKLQWLNHNLLMVQKKTKQKKKNLNLAYRDLMQITPSYVYNSS